ncbi:MAG: hypothetical protein ACFFEF_03740 [Candidatus Thorarchaeota archaeon]
MLRRITVFCLILAILWSPALVSAQASYGLSWGVSVSDKIPYTVEVASSGTGFGFVNRTYSEDVILTVVDLPDLSEYQTYDIFPPMARTNITYANGTIIHYFEPLFGNVVSIVIFPIGNWTHYRYLTELGTDSVFSEDLFTWSMYFEYSPDNGQSYQNATYQFSKADGALSFHVSYFHTEFDYEGGYTYTLTTTAKISRSDFGLSVPLLTLSAVIIIVGVVIGIEIVRRYRGRHATAVSV